MRSSSRFAAVIGTIATVVVLSAGLSACSVPTPVSNAAKCGSASAVPATYDHVVVIMEENRTWDTVGGVGFTDPFMPFLRDLGSSCTVFKDWVETNTNQNSLNQYIGLTSGVSNPATVNDCSPSATCRSTDDNLFRQIRRSGGTVRTYVDGANASCSEGSNKSKHIPALYYYGTYTDGGVTHSDHDFCDAEVRPLGELDPNNLPTFTMIVPDQCNDGHDCLNNAVDVFAQRQLQPILDSSAYAAGRTAVMVMYDEDRPVPNLLIAPTARPGIQSLPGAGHAAMLRTWEEMLGLPVLSTPALAAAPSLRSAANL